MASLTLHFVRHGETGDNAVRRFQLPDAPLSERGREQAAAVAQVLAAKAHADALYASDYARAFETATIIGGVLGLPVAPEPALRERNFGYARGRLYSEIGEATIATWRDPFLRIPEGESWADVDARIGRFLDGLRAAPPARELILVTHGGAMSIALAYLANQAIAEFRVLPLENCALRTISVELAV
jgi:broad specificity phosphatase PhoE